MKISITQLRLLLPEGRSCHRYATQNYLPHAEKEDSVKNIHCLAVNLSLEKRLQELTSRKNLELESHRQFVVVINLVLATPATSMAPDRTGPAVLSGSVFTVERGVLLTVQELVLNILLPWPVPWRGHSSFASASNQHGKRQLPVISHNA